MEINAEGHLLTSPREVCERLNEPARLINDVLIPGTPVAFPSYTRYCDFLAQLKALPLEACCGLPRPIDAFIFRDWWSLYSRWEFDLRDLRKALRDGLEPGGDVPRLPRS